MPCHSAMLQLTLVAAIGLTTVGCQSMAVAMDDPLAYDSGPAQPAGMNAYKKRKENTMRNKLYWVFLVASACGVFTIHDVPDTCAYHEGGGMGGGGGCVTQIVTGPYGSQLCTTCCNVSNPNDCTTFCYPVMGTQRPLK